MAKIKLFIYIFLWEKCKTSRAFGVLNIGKNGTIGRHTVQGFTSGTIGTNVTNVWQQ